MTLRFEVRGPEAAPVVLLSAGLGGLGAYWAPQMAVLAGYRVITFDQRGTGKNREALPEPYSIAAMAEDVVEVLDAAGVARCHFIGHALGGAVGMALALAHPGRVASLVPVNAWARLDPHTQRCFAVRTEILRASGVAAYVRAQPIFLHPAAWLSEHAEALAEEEARGVAHFQGSETLLRRIAALSAFDVAGRLGEIAVPVLAMANRDDMLVPWTRSREIGDGVQAGELAVFETGGHAGNVTDPGPFNARLVAFLEGVGEG